MDVGFIGLGAMGAPMAANLATRFLTRVWNRTPEVALSHQQQHGTMAVADLGDLAGVQVVCSCLPTDVEVEDVATRLVSVLEPGTVWIDHTSADPRGARRVAQLLGERGVAYLDAPVSGGTAGAQAGTLTVMIGGEASVLARVEPVLDAVAANTQHVGPIGAGMAVKAVNNALFATSLWAAAEGLAALTRAGVSASTATDVINRSSGRSNVTENVLGPRVFTREFPPTFALSLLAKDVRLANQVLDDAGIDGSVLSLVGQLTSDASDRLGAGADHVELVRIVEDAAGIELR